MDMVEKVCRAMCASGGLDPDDMQANDGPRWRYYEPMARAAIAAMREPGDAWDGLARQLIMWMDMEPKTPHALFKHLERSGHDVPAWLRDEPEMQALDHVPSKGTRAVLVYRAIIDAALGGTDAA